eukprot:364671-Chlamydomonas_euryale.AAC.5
MHSRASTTHLRQRKVFHARKTGHEPHGRMPQPWQLPAVSLLLSMPCMAAPCDIAVPGGPAMQPAACQALRDGTAESVRGRRHRGHSMKRKAGRMPGGRSLRGPEAARPKDVTPRGYWVLAI